jgi:polyphosphate glucokinase
MTEANDVPPAPPPMPVPPPAPAVTPPPAPAFATGGPAMLAPAAPFTPTVIGVDIGGSGIKGAPVDLVQGSFASDRIRIETPQPATPDAVAGVVADLTSRFGGTGPLGITLPAVVRAGVVETAANIDHSWIGTDAVALLEAATGRRVAVVNDADAAGVAEMRFGAGQGVGGLVLMVTLGTGIGTAMFVDGVLVPNTELGHLPLKGGDAEDYAAESVREAEGLSYKQWAKRVERYLLLVERLVWPELIIIGGGVSKHADKFLPRIHLHTPVVPAQLHNDAGIVGAALFAPPA